MQAQPFTRKTGDQVAAECLHGLASLFTVRLPGRREPLPGSRFEMDQGQTLLLRAQEAGPRHPKLLSALGRVTELLRSARRPRLLLPMPLLLVLLLSVGLPLWLFAVRPLLLPPSASEASRMLAEDIAINQLWLQQACANQSANPATVAPVERLERRLDRLRAVPVEQRRQAMRATARERSIRWLMARGWIAILLIVLLPLSVIRGYRMLHRQGQVERLAGEAGMLRTALIAFAAPLLALPLPTPRGQTLLDPLRLARLNGLLGLLLIALLAPGALLVWLCLVALLRNTLGWGDAFIEHLLRRADVVPGRQPAQAA